MNRIRSGLPLLLAGAILMTAPGAVAQTGTAGEKQQKALELKHPSQVWMTDKGLVSWSSGDSRAGSYRLNYRVERDNFVPTQITLTTSTRSYQIPNFDDVNYIEVVVESRVAQNSALARNPYAVFYTWYRSAADRVARLPAPANVQVDNTGQVSWDAVTGAAGYLGIHLVDSREFRYCRPDPLTATSCQINNYVTTETYEVTVLAFSGQDFRHDSFGSEFVCSGNCTDYMQLQSVRRELQPPPPAKVRTEQRISMKGTDGRLDEHAAAPVAVYGVQDSLALYAVVSATEGLPLGVIPSVAALRAGGHGGGELARMMHPTSGKPIVVHYLAAEQLVEIGTFYEDVPPYQVDKPYIFRIDESNSVTIMAW